MANIDQDLIDMYNEGFKQFDPDSKGFIKPRVLQQALKHIGFNPSNKELEQLIVDVDCNGNGRIELDEFIQATKKLTDKTKAIKEGGCLIYICYTKNPVPYIFPRDIYN